MNLQLPHQEIKRETSKREIVLIAEGLNHPENYGGLIRTAEALGVKQLIFVTEVYQELTTKMKRVSRSAENYINVSFDKSIEDCLEQFNNKDYHYVALEYTNQSIPIQTYRTSKDKIVLICGNENFGISEQVLSMVQDTIKIPVYGTTSSLNVVVATGIALYHLRHI